MDERGVEEDERLRWLVGCGGVVIAESQFSSQSPLFPFPLLIGLCSGGGIVAWVSP
jgi:hypothetical protein